MKHEKDTAIRPAQDYTIRMRYELAGVLRIFERDDIATNRVKRASGPGVMVFMTRKKIARIKKLLREGTA